MFRNKYEILGSQLHCDLNIVSNQLIGFNMSHIYILKPIYIYIWGERVV